MKKIGLIVVSDYYQKISENLLKNCITTLKNNGLEEDIKTVKGSLEIPTLIAHQINKKKYKFYEVPISYNGRSYEEGKKIGLKDAFIALKAIILYSIK